MADAASAAGAGSLWNPNSWHWESRNYDKWAHEVVVTRLKTVAVGDGDVSVKITDVADAKVEATINIRKGKKIPVFDITFKAKWQGVQGGSTATGDVAVTDLMPDDVNDDFSVRVSAPGSAPLDGRCKTLMQTAGAAGIRAEMRAFAEQLVEHDGGLEKLALDAKRRAEEAARADAARADKGDEKDRIARGATARDAARKAELAASAPPAAVSASASASAAPVGTGSVWNAGSYHWEEKPLTPWARERLTALLKDDALELPGGSVRVVDVTLTGDASTSVRKGRKLVFFDFKVTAKWEGSLLDGDGNVLGTGDGEIVVPELDQDNADEFTLRVTAADDGGASDRQLKALLDKHGVPILRTKIAQFITELKARG